MLKYIIKYKRGVGKIYITITRPKKDDEKEILDLFEKTIKKAFKDEGVEEDIEGMKEELLSKKNCLKQDFKTNGKDRYFLIAKMENKIVGTISFGKSNDLINKITKNEYKNILEIATVYILPEYQGNGIGKKLFNAIIISMISRGITEFCLDSGYTKARNYWTKKLGNPTIIEKNYWGENAHHMIWKRKIENISIKL